MNQDAHDVIAASLESGLRRVPGAVRVNDAPQADDFPNAAAVQSLATSPIAVAAQVDRTEAVERLFAAPQSQRLDGATSRAGEYAVVGNRETTALVKLLNDSQSAKRGATVADAIFADLDVTWRLCGPRRR